MQRLTENETEAFLLLTGTPGKRTFWLQGKRVTIRRCTVSVALRKQTATLRLDCQTAYGTPQPDAGTVSTVGRALPWGGTFLLGSRGQTCCICGSTVCCAQALPTGLTQQKTPARSCRQTLYFWVLEKSGCRGKVTVMVVPTST